MSLFRLQNKLIQFLNPSAPIRVEQRIANKERMDLMAVTPEGFCYEWYHKKRCHQRELCNYRHDKSIFKGHEEGGEGGDDLFHALQ